MHLTLEVKKYHEFFWLRSIRAVNIYRCCAECFIGQKDNRVYYGTLHKASAYVDIDIKDDPKAVAYYVCGLSAGFVWSRNKHIAFVPAPGEVLAVDSDDIRLTITDARRIEFEGYRPNPHGFFTQKQRTCRNWIFANYINDGMLRGGHGHGNG